MTKTKPTERPTFRLRLRGAFADQVVGDIHEFGHDGGEAAVGARTGVVRVILVNSQTWPAVSYVLGCLELLDEAGQDADYRAHGRHAKAALARCAAAGWVT